MIPRLAPFVYVDDGYGGGTGHGTAHDYDRHVPVVFLGAGITAGRHEAESGPEDIAPTLARLLGLDYRLEAGQRVLAEALERPEGEHTGSGRGAAMSTTLQASKMRLTTERGADFWNDSCAVPRAHGGGAERRHRGDLESGDRVRGGEGRPPDLGARHRRPDRERRRSRRGARSPGG